ncbi:unnamed protein product [Lactuca saligna]|uniref:Uncharacterized protein n=1 Tax=Lactuca saligna TaxID=75948 RepID=A0AA35ZAQ3_LACSI|nr:unnamed protein product [Lactuca saligna]
MLKRIEGVLDPSSLPKQKGEPMKQSKKETLKPSTTTFKPKSENETKDNEPSGSKGKEKISDERIIDDSEEEEPDEHELKIRKARESQIDEHNLIVKEEEEKEKAEREAQVTLETRKLLFPLCTLERIMNEAINNPRQYLLEHIVSFDMQNIQDSQLDFPITPKSLQVL